MRVIRNWKLIDGGVTHRDFIKNWDNNYVGRSYDSKKNAIADLIDQLEFDDVVVPSALRMAYINASDKNQVDEVIATRAFAGDTEPAALVYHVILKIQEDSNG